MADNNIPEHEKDFVLSLYEAQEQLGDIFNVLAVQDEDIDPSGFIVGFSEIISRKFECLESERVVLDQHVRSVVSTLVERTANKFEAGESETSIRFYNDFLIASFPQFIQERAFNHGFISEAAASYKPNTLDNLH